jgi:hypothetical protein
MKWSRSISRSMFFTESFRRQHDLEIAFEDAARRRLVERAQTEKMSMADLTAHLFRDFHFGLNLVRKNSGQNKFTLPLFGGGRAGQIS